MVTRSCERVSNIFENAFLIVLYAACFSMHQSFCADNFSSERTDYSLMPQTNAQRGYLATQVLQDFFADAKVTYVFSRAWTRRENYSVRLKFSSLFQGYLVISADNDPST
jgi:hypothetical protein